MSDITLFGFGPSVYTRIVKLVLAEKSISYQFEELNPFAEQRVDDVARLHPFGRVPIIKHADFRVYETAAICRYLDAQFPTPALTPTDAKPLARMTQVIGIVDAHGYWPMVRQVFAHRVFRPHEGLDANEHTVAQGLTDAQPVLAALDPIAEEGLVLNAQITTLADCHLAPMMAAFTAAPEGRAALENYDALSVWWQTWITRDSMRATDAGFDHLATSDA
ncbi:MAG: glutathione S-transferase family protein [Hyphomicrobiales bacterium]